MPLGEVIIPGARVQARVDEMARAIGAAFPGGPIHAVIVLKSAVFFGVDLLRALERDVTVGFLHASSYGDGTRSSGRVELALDAVGAVAGRNVLLVDDILDTGHTLAAASTALRALGPAHLETCVLLDKPARRVVSMEADHMGFPVEDVFVVGYGLDCGEGYRTLPDIRAFRPEETAG